LLDFKKTFIGISSKNDILSGLVVSVALVPEAIAFSFIAHISPIVGLYTAFILGLAVVLVGLSLNAKHLLEAQGLGGNALAYGIIQYITMAAILAGFIQVLIGFLKMGKFIRLVPQPALHGFVNGLAIVIAISQFKFLSNAHITMYVIILGTMAIMYFLPKFTTIIPAGLVAIIFFTIIIYVTGIDTKLVGDLADLSPFKGALPSFKIPGFMFDLSSYEIVLPYALIIALVGVIESLLTLSVLDELKEGRRGSGNQECMAQGIGNIACGLFGAMPGCAMIGQSIINYTSGGTGRLSGIVASLGLMTLVATFTGILSIIPIGILVGIIRVDAFVLVTVAIVTIEYDLAIAVISGVIISALAFAWKHAKVYTTAYIQENGTKVYNFDGPLFFGSVSAFNEQFDVKNDPQNIILDFKNTRVLDISGVRRE